MGTGIAFQDSNLRLVDEAIRKRSRSRWPQPEGFEEIVALDARVHQQWNQSYYFSGSEAHTRRQISSLPRRWISLAVELGGSIVPGTVDGSVWHLRTGHLVF